MAKSKLANNKTSVNKSSVTQFIANVADERRRKDSKTLLKIFKELTGRSPKMWGTSIVGYDQYHYQYDSGREGDMPMVGFSPRKQSMVVYIMPGFSKVAPLLTKLGKHKIGKSCLYINKLEDVDEQVLRKVITHSYQAMQRKYPK